MEICNEDRYKIACGYGSLRRIALRVFKPTPPRTAASTSTAIS